MLLVNGIPKFDIATARLLLVSLIVLEAAFATAATIAILFLVLH
jgi:hypothetical protein